MKIEKINDNQIRCTLNKSDLASRQLKISELAYGSEKARELFRDMMRQANYELGFEAEDLPLMIEAIPVSAECIVLIITKVDNPEELDTRFSRFSDSDESEDFEDYDYNDFDDDSDDDEDEDMVPGKLSDELDSVENLDSEIQDLGNDLMNIFSQVKDYLNKKMVSPNSDSFVPLSQSISNANGTNKSAKDNKDNKDSIIKDNTADVSTLTPPVVVRVFSFNTLDDATDAALIINPIYSDDSTFFKDTKDNHYYLAITRKNTSSVNFNKICNILSEYGKKETMDVSSVDYFKEHQEVLIKKHAVQILTTI